MDMMSTHLNDANPQDVATAQSYLHQQLIEQNVQQANTMLETLDPNNLQLISFIMLSLLKNVTNELELQFAKNMLTKLNPLELGIVIDWMDSRRSNQES